MATGALPPLLVSAERVAQTVAQGVHGRRRVGIGEAFWQFRPYHPGDNPLRIDWRQTARSQSVHVREYEWAAAQTVWLWRDPSSSMRYASQLAETTKRERAELLLIALAVLLNRAGERPALAGGLAPPTMGRVSLSRMAQQIEGEALHDSNDLPPSSSLPRSAELVLFSDFLAPLPDLQAVVTAHANGGVRGHLVQILDPAEETLPFDGRIRFTGMEGEADILVPKVQEVRQDYARRLSLHRAALTEMAQKAGLDLHRPSYRSARHGRAAFRFTPPWAGRIPTGARMTGC